MPSRPNQRLSSQALAADRAILAAVANLPDYAPNNPAYSIAALLELNAVVLETLQNESRLLQEADLARDKSIAALQALHKGVKGLRAQVIAQYGDDSAALHAIGLKKSSERKRPVRRAKETV